MYANITLREDGVFLDGPNEGEEFQIPATWLRGLPKINSERGYFHSVTLTLNVNEIRIEPEAYFEAGSR